MLLKMLRLLLHAADAQEENGSVKLILRMTSANLLPIHLLFDSNGPGSELFLSHVETDPKSAAKMLQTSNNDEDKQQPLELLFSSCNVKADAFAVSLLERMIRPGAPVTERVLQAAEQNAQPPAATEKDKQILSILRTTRDEQNAEKKRKKEEQSAKRAAAAEAKKQKRAATAVRRSTRRS